MNKLHEWARRVLPVRTLLLMALGLFLVLIAAGYIFDWQWTWFPNKNLFNWLAILFFPAAVAVGSFLQQESKALTRVRSQIRVPAISSSSAGTACRFNGYDERCIESGGEEPRRSNAAEG